MSGPPFTDEQGEALRAVAGAAAPAGALPAPEAPSGGVKRQLRRIVKGAVRRGLGWYVGEAANQAVAARVTTLARLGEALEHTAERAEQLRSLPVNLELLKGEVSGLRATEANLDLLKAEVRKLQATLEDLGRALAPGAGLEAAGARVAELRERVNGLERRVRQGEGSGAASPSASPPVTSTVTPAASSGAQTSTLFDYVGFERRFRGDPDEVLSTLRERYGSQLASHAPVLDVGCGRGELLAALAADGIEVLGCEPDPGMAADARARGLDVHAADALTFLEQRAERSLGSIISTHVVEHLELDYLIRFLELSASRLVPGGLFIAETPNPASLIVLGNSYILDPTHVRPLHPSLLAFLCEGAGFREVTFGFYSPAEGYHLPMVDDPSVPELSRQVNEALTKLNEVLFGPQEYAVLATTPS
jgi:SAM-dependent methyltransferase